MKEIEHSVKNICTNLTILINKLAQSQISKQYTDSEINTFCNEKILPMIKKEIITFFADEMNKELGDYFKINMANNGDIEKQKANNKPNNFKNTFNDNNLIEINSIEKSDDKNIQKQNHSINDTEVLYKNMDIIKLIKQQENFGNVQLVLRLKQKELDLELLKDILTLYQKYYNHPEDKITKELKKILLSNTNFNISFKHANLHFSANKAISFEKVNIHSINSVLDENELIKIKNQELESEVGDNMVLFEFCPQILIDNEIIYPGKIIAS